MREAISEQILNAAATLFYKDGIRAVGIDRIIEEADVAKATLYRHFPSKDHLVAAYLQARHERVLQSLHEVLATVQEPRARISTIFERLREKADNADFEAVPLHSPWPNTETRRRSSPSRRRTRLLFAVFFQRS